MIDAYKYAYISGAATTQVFTGLGRLIAIVVNTPAAATIGLIDGTAGTTVNIGQLAASVPANRYKYGITLAQGLRIITAGATDITVIYAPQG